MKHRTPITAAFLALAVMWLASPEIRAESDSEKIAVLFESSFTYEAKGNIDHALNDVLQILRIDPKSYIANYRAGWLYFLKGRYADSLAFYKKSAQFSPKAIEAKVAMMQPLMAQSRWGEAEGVGKEVLSKAPGNYLACSRLAFVYFSQGKYAEAEKQYKATLEAFPSEIDMMLGLGWTYVKLGRKAEARKMFEGVLTIRRQNLNARAGLEAL
ncbi:MAG: tetratricopeptide repeat protein [Myxococcota bacterium]|jgi:tetratricopeptide (TPR) repeat protein|nr:tetratricopeptide repeat protein [Myxococcota bacterium]